MDTRQRIGCILQEQGYEEYRGKSEGRAVYVRREGKFICAVEVLSIPGEECEEQRGQKVRDGQNNQNSPNSQNNPNTPNSPDTKNSQNTRNRQIRPDIDTETELAREFHCSREDIHILRLVVCDHVTSMLREVKDPFCWIIDKSTNRLLIYEDRVSDFYGLRCIIEQGMAEETEQTGSAGQNKGPSFAESQNLYFEMRERLRKIPVTTTLLLVNVILFLLCAFWSDGALFLYGMGMLQAPAVLRQGEYWRVLTSMFLHADTAHLFSNMIMLLFVGEAIERIMGSLPYLLLYLFSGILGNIFSLALDVLQGGSGMSLGASGAVFGVMGAMLLLVFVQRHRLQREVVFRVALGVGCCLYNGFVTTGINNAAHVGGMTGGLICCGIWLLYMRKKQKSAWLPENAR